jgi:thioredoxin 1
MKSIVIPFLFVCATCFSQCKNQAEQKMEQTSETIITDTPRVEKATKPATETAFPLAGITPALFTELVKSDKLVLVDFSATWCGPCKMLKPIVEKLSEEKKATLRLFPIDTDDNQELAAKLNISSIPHLKLFKNGAEVWSSVGYIDENELRKAIAPFE